MKNQHQQTGERKKRQKIRQRNDFEKKDAKADFESNWSEIGGDEFE